MHNLSNKEISELPVQDPTLEALVHYFERNPKKKYLYTDYCAEYKVLDYEEFTEAMGLELLEICDSSAYIKLTREYKKLKKLEEHQELVDTIDRYLKAYNEDHIVLDRVEDCWLIAKRSKMHVHTVNENPIFQPYEQTRNREFFIIALVKASEDFVPSELMTKFLTRNILMMKIFDVADVKRRFEDIK